MEKLKTIKSIFNIHPLTYLFVILGFMFGFFKRIILYMFIIICHELGHLFVALLFHWNVGKVYIYPLGGITKFNDVVNKPFYQELLVTVFGPLIQIVVTIYLSKYDCSIKYFSNALLFFNLLPIVPLDGGRLVFILINKIFPLKKCIKYIIMLSFYIYFLFLYYFMFKYNSLFFLVTFIFLIFKIFDEKRELKYYFDKFLLERYMYSFKFKTSVVIDNICRMYKYKNNLFLKNNLIYNEKEILKIYFKR